MSSCEIKEKEKAIKFNVEWYVSAIVEIFSESRKKGEKNVYAVNIGLVSGGMHIEVAYSKEQVEKKQFFCECGSNEMEEGNVKEIVRKINQDDPPSFYREKVKEYFQENLEEDFEEDEFVIIMKQ